MNSDVFKAYRDQLAKEELEIESLRQQLASRDTEIAEINTKFDERFAAYLEDRAALIIERDQLREQMTLLWDALISQTIF